MELDELNQQLATLLGAMDPVSPVKKLALSMIFFSDVRPEISDRQRYQLVQDLTRFADRHQFEAIYLPERHFCQFGAIFPNSAVMAANLIPLTQHVRFRTAGISLPLHHPVEVVEWWAMNDVLSGGRVDLGFGSGWNKADFILAPERYERRREELVAQIDTVKRLWRGESLSFAGPEDENYAIRVFPSPLQPELNIWMLVARNKRGFAEAGRLGANLFTMLYGDDIDSLSKKISLYRQARAEAGFDPDAGRVTLMLHTLIGRDKEWVRQAVETPFKAYIKSTIPGHLQAQNRDHYDAAGQQQILDYAWLRYFEHGALFGSVDDATMQLNRVLAAGVNEVACLMDFGVDHAKIHASLPWLSQLTSLYV
ncbi:LLM class flavin-dependent oxidoreductase [Xenorhabdus bovienii]|uniref:MupA/Atu3671 family FMN-dependent luciferase-like monooxygenase n=1 Tax=Xenorhabdus bovienii TaxID=40576 RepID=UPI0023B2BBC7|nr:MupA/Atu3671 family FMN-dependent luciferase-like monooxygenase [Xenorhabdus bovienii]MDE9482421.1 LLM class flavin-dependent oxidoreductase [Xenorhabdus bovienii]MDE9556297.1 LLM class flavin-dependent oxidoreductase [Xenorhabdus bovienii]